PNSRSTGSFFKNPVVSGEKFFEVEGLAEEASVPHFPAGHGMEKIPAAWLIEKAGFHKGFCLGNAGISTNHSLALINRGGASAAEILDLKDLIVSGVASKFGIELVPEPIFVGFGMTHR
ncbi:MAG: UDP-N-acetylenolpyruvoylglucosamine reductase, partial [Acidobacteria bacterium]|nr:UDP-N-acetylenolpyruvoylglucosamine reductase [Acidobacteriota bacterium]